MFASPLSRSCIGVARTSCARSLSSVSRALRHPLQPSVGPLATSARTLCTAAAAGAIAATRAPAPSVSFGRVRHASTQACGPSSANGPCQPQVLHTIAEVRAVAHQVRREGGTLGFVPTMGALHAGHVALAARSMQENTNTIVSIFVNPTQFLPGEDLSSYPRTLESDLAALGAVGVPYVFAPSVGEMYPSWPSFFTSVSIDDADSSCEGARRPGHFKGVATVVSKLLHIVQPVRAYFGQKDGMQCVVIRRLVRDLNFDTDICVCPTVRAADGLALSSRNVYLTPEERAAAPVLFRALTAANNLYLSGERDAARLKQAAQTVLEAEKRGHLEYVSLATADSGHEVTSGTIADVRLDWRGEVESGGAMLSIAYKLGKPRLIDNCILGQQLRAGEQ